MTPKLHGGGETSSSASYNRPGFMERRSHAEEELRQPKKSFLVAK